MNRDTLGIISTVSTLVPVLIAIINWKGVSRWGHFFLAFIIYGLLTDVSVGLLKDSHRSTALLLYCAYAVMETVFYLFYLRYGFKKDALSIPLNILIFLAPVLWVLCHVDLSTMSLMAKPYNNIYVSSFEIIISFACGHRILKMIEEESVDARNHLLFLRPVFIYCFTTFFINAFVQSVIGPDLWYLHNIINIITNLIFAYAFLKSQRTAH